MLMLDAECVLCLDSDPQSLAGQVNGKSNWLLRKVWQSGAALYYSRASRFVRDFGDGALRLKQSVK